jgi:two-component system OmpR family response regulator
MIDGLEFALPKREHQVLMELVLRFGRVTRKDAIATKISRYGETVGDNAIEIYISRLRKRLLPHGLAILTYPGSGYQLKNISDSHE